MREVARPHLPRGLWLASVPFPQWGPWAHLTEVVQDLEDREQAGPDEQPHLAPNVTCRWAQGGHWGRDIMGAAEPTGTGAGKS